MWMEQGKTKYEQPHELSAVPLSGIVPLGLMTFSSFFNEFAFAYNIRLVRKDELGK